MAFQGDGLFRRRQWGGSWADSLSKAPSGCLAGPDGTMEKAWKLQWKMVIPTIRGEFTLDFIWYFMTFLWLLTIKTWDATIKTWDVCSPNFRTRDELDSQQTEIVSLVSLLGILPSGLDRYSLKTWDFSPSKQKLVFSITTWDVYHQTIVLVALKPWDLTI